jgi:renal tumor antigen
MECNMYEYIKGRKKYLDPNLIKYCLWQLLKSVDHMHRNGIFHRDIKPENILLRGEQVKLADFGSCKGIYSDVPYTEYISTRWYRPPECLLTDGYYSKEVKI